MQFSAEIVEGNGCILALVWNLIEFYSRRYRMRKINVKYYEERSLRTTRSAIWWNKIMKMKFADIFRCHDNTNIINVIVSFDIGIFDFDEI